MKTDRPAEYRYVNQAVGAFVVITVLIVGVTAAQSDVLRRWFNPRQQVKVLLPQEGLYGLSAGAKVEVLGTEAGEVGQIVIDPNQQIHAEVYIRRDMLGFIRSDSKAMIRKQFGVAGASYLEITRGYGTPLDWDYAVLEAEADRGPTDLVQALIRDLRTELLPVIDDAKRAIEAYADLGEQLSDPDGSLNTSLASLSEISEGLNAGEGAVGRLLKDDDLAEQLEQTIASVNESLARLEPVFAELEQTTRNISTLTGGLAERTEDLPELTEALKENLASLRAILADVRKTTPQLPSIAERLAESTEGLPSLVAQTNETLFELERLTEQLQSHWLIGGGDRPAGPQGGRLDLTEAGP